MDEVLEQALGEIDKLASEARQQMNNLNDSRVQLKQAAVIVNNFVTQTLQAVNGSDDVAAVNEILANSMLQINNFMAERPTAVTSQILSLEQKIDAYDASKTAVSTTFSEALQRKEREEKRLQELATSLDEDGKYTQRRKVGEKPPRLKDIRNAASLRSEISLDENTGDNIEQEDI